MIRLRKFYIPTERQQMHVLLPELNIEAIKLQTTIIHDHATTGSRCCNPAVAIEALQIKDFLRLEAVATGNFVFSDEASRP